MATALNLLYLWEAAFYWIFQKLGLDLDLMPIYAM